MARYTDALEGKYPAKEHAKKVVDLMRKTIPDLNGVLYIEGRKTKLLEDNDEPEPFRQRRYFYYMTGCDLPDCHFVYDVATSKSTLFIPPIDPDSVIWSGLPVSASEALELYDVDQVQYTTEVNAALVHFADASPTKPVTAYAIREQVSEQITFLQYDKFELTTLKSAIEAARVVKTEYELGLIQKANDVSAVAHDAVLRMVKKVKNEQELEAVFIGKCIAQGAKKQAYHSIVASGRAAATLHYVKNDAPMEGKLNLLLDAGAEWSCYASDITRSFPISGKFTPESRAIYDIVLKMQLECMAMMKEGVSWESVHSKAHKVAIDGLIGLGILKGDPEEIFAAGTSVAFFPHGLGHYLGMDTHDSGGNPNYSDPNPMFRYLRMRGTLPAGCVITVEPGVYFCKFIIEPYLGMERHAKYIDADVLEKYWDVGGVRIEDNILVTPTGIENLTNVVKDPDEMEKIISES